MIYIRKSLVIGLILICAIALTFTLAGCAKENEGSKTITLVIGEGEDQTVFESYKTDAEYLIDVLVEMKEAEKITYTLTESTYGAYLTEINGILEANGQYVYLFSTVAEQQDITEWKVTKNYNDTVFVSVIYGASTLEVIDGAGYMIALV